MPHLVEADTAHATHDTIDAGVMVPEETNQRLRALQEIVEARTACEAAAVISSRRK